MDKKGIIFFIAITVTAYIQPLVARNPISRETHLITIASSILLAFYLAWFVSTLNLRKKDAYILTGITLFTVGHLNNILEAYFFTDFFRETTTLAAAIIFSLIMVLIQSTLTIYILKPNGSMTLKTAIFNHVKSIENYPLRIAAASVAYFLVYFTFGLIVSPFVVPIYTNPQSGLSIPSFSLMVPVEILRGSIYAIVLTAVFASLRKEKNLSFKAATALLLIPGAFIPLISSLTLMPVLNQVVLYHSLELIADSTVYSYIASRMLVKDKFE